MAISRKNTVLSLLKGLLAAVGLTLVWMAIVAATVLVGSLASSWASFRLSRVDPGTVLREGN